MVPLGLFATGLLVRAIVGLAFAGPAYPDSYYYAHVAQQFAAGHGLTVDYLWNLDDIGGVLPAVAHLPVAANGLWMPLAEFVQVPTIWLLGPTILGASLPFALIGALAAPLAYWIGIDAGVSRRASIAAGLLVAAPAGLTPFVAQPDNFALFMVLGPLSLMLCARGMRGDRRAFAAGGLVVGLATLARNDGFLLGLPFVLVVLREHLPGRARVIGWQAAIACGVLVLLILGPWMYRQYEVFGSVSPSAGSGRLLWLTDYQQAFSFSNPPSFDGWLAQGFSELALSRVRGLLSALGLFALLPLAAVMAPFAVIGAWARRRDRAFWPFFVYTGTLFAVMALLFPVLIPHGTFIHSAVALVPHAYLLVIAGVESTVSWVARRRSTWQVDNARRVFTYGTVVVALIIAGLQTTRVIGSWSDVRTVQQQLAASIRDAPPQDRFMAVDPGAINYLTGRQGILTPADPLPVIESTMRAYDVRWLVLESSSIVPALVPVLEGSVRPSWLSAPVTVVPEPITVVPEPIARATSPGTAVAPAGAVYAVCFDPADARCAQ